MRSGITCLLMLTLGACGLPEEKQIPERPVVPDGGASAAHGLPTNLTLPPDIVAKARKIQWVSEDPDAVEVARQGIFTYCGGTYVRYCNNPTPQDPWNGWYYDQPGAQEVQVFNGSVCIIAACNYWIPEVGFEAGGLGDMRQMSGMWGENLYVKTGSNASATLYPNVCWSGNYTWIWPGFTSTFPVNGSYKSFACFPA